MDAPAYIAALKMTGIPDAMAPMVLAELARVPGGSPRAMRVLIEELKTAAAMYRRRPESDNGHAHSATGAGMSEYGHED